MPTMEEIAEALRATIKVASNETRHVYMGLCPEELEGFDSRDEECDACKILIKAKQLAANVEQMRCDTCWHWSGQLSGVTGIKIPPYCEMLTVNCGPNFGCWHWEEKEVKNG